MEEKWKVAMLETAEHAEEFADALKSGEADKYTKYTSWRRRTHGACALCKTRGRSSSCFVCPINFCNDFVPKGTKTTFENNIVLTKRSRIRWWYKTAETLRNMVKEG